MKDFKINAIKLYEKADYKESLLQYSLFLKEEDEDKEAKLGVLLCDLAFENEDQSKILYSYYKNLRTKVTNAEDVMFNIIETLDDNIQVLNRYVSENSKESLLSADAIIYEDFKDLIESRGSFKRAFEDLIFSTKVLIDNKDDFKDFISQLIDNDYFEMSYIYLEMAIATFPYEKGFKNLFSKLQDKENLVSK